jgi:hypothetical protein
VDEGETALGMLDIASEWRQQPVGIAARWLDLDYIGAEVGEPAGRIRRGDITHLDHPEVAERRILSSVLVSWQLSIS